MNMKTTFLKRWNAANSSNQENIFTEAQARYEFIQGGDPNVFPYRALDVAKDEEDLAADIGAVYDEEKQVWMAPEGIPVEQFRDFWPKIPKDLRAPNRRKLLVKNGKAREAYVLPDDEVRGSDSLALPWMYAALPILSILTFGVVQLLGVVGVLLAFPLAAFTLPYLIAISQSEGVKEGFKSFVLLYLLPLILSMGMGSSFRGMIPGAMNSMAGASAVLAELGGYISLFIIYMALAGFYCAVLTVEREDNKNGYLGTKFDKFRGLVKFGALLLVLMFFTNAIPNLLQALNVPVLKHLVHFKPLGFYALACLYPLYYASNEKVMRAQKLKVQENDFRGSKLGALATIGDQNRNTQYVEAVKDTTPLLTLGTALGVTEDKLYSYSYSAGGTIVMSIKDASQHVMILGATGAGKTESMILPWILQVKSFRIVE